GPRDVMDDQGALACPHVESANVTLRVRFALGDSGGSVRGADNHDVLSDDRRRMESDFTGGEIDFLIVIELQIDGAIVSEAGYRHSCFGIETDQAVARRNVEDPFLSPIRPVRQTAAR